ncbi:MAG: hypothetical protein IV085_01300 [Thiobacillus sp.]|nr:hypothetical protein [Thiobacillus sp.]
MLMLIPHLFPPPPMLETASSAMRAPALEHLLARGRLKTCPAEGVEAALCHALGIPRQQDWPIAPIALEADGGQADDAYWLRADPVHLRVMRDRIVMADSDALNLTQPESDALTDAIGAHFGAALRPRALQPAHWYLQLADAPRLQTTPLAIAAGRDIQPLMPRGEDAQKFRSMLNELQMLFHTHPVNQVREQRGELAVNALWLWGGGTKPAAVGESSVTLFTENRTARSLAAWSGTPVKPSAQALPTTATSRTSIVVLDQLTPSGQCGDMFGWWETLSVLEHNWFVPLRESLGRLGLDALTLSDPVNGITLRVDRADLWKFWRRPKRLHEVLSVTR